jgi:alpha-beta hydrolase superfamily lysophospholipase
MTIFNNSETYLNFYKLSRWESIHNSTRIKTKEHNVYTQSFFPKERKGVIIIVHGYLDHSASLANLIDFLLIQRYAVVTFDLPGHGFSLGERGDIRNFEVYSYVLHKVLTLYTRKNEIKDRECAIIGHSTGAAIILSYLGHYKNPFSKIIMVAPLVQPYLWSFSRIGVKLIGKKVKSVKRKYRRNSSNTDYLHFVKKDPLQFSKLPIGWLHSLEAWTKSTKSIGRREEVLSIIQGSRDRTVNWKYNVSFLLEKFPESTCTLIDDGNHQLFNEKDIIKEITFYHINKILEN